MRPTFVEQLSQLFRSPICPSLEQLGQLFYKKMIQIRRTQLALGILFLAITPPIWSAPRDAARHVSSGIEKHRGGDFAGAEQEFVAAAKTSPDDLRVTFDQACALAAQGKHDEAEKLFEKTKLARDPQLASNSLYNLGWSATQRAQEKFGKQPENATPEVRAEGLKHLEQAVAHYRSCLAVNPSHADARHNLELLRLWIKHMQEMWKQHDREKRRNEMDLLAFLEMLQSEQILLRDQTRALIPTEDSPRRRQSATLLGQTQRELSEEIEPLQKKLRESITQPAKDPAAASTPPTAEQEQVLAAVTELAQQARNSMARAATDLTSNNLTAAEESQSQSLEPLNELYRAIAPFNHILGKAIRVQEKQIETVKSIEATPSTNQEDRWVEHDVVTGQRQVAGWAEALKPKAEQELKSLKSQPAVAGPAPAPNSSAQATDPVAQRAALEATYQKAIELAPRAHDAAKEAADHLEHRAWTDARPKQEEALKLLKEIEQQLPKQPKQDQNEQQDQQKEKQQEDQQKQQQQQKQQEDEQNQQDKQQEQQKNGSSQSKEKQKEKISQQQAEAMLRQVREREREYRDQQKRHAIVGGVKVEKDW